MYVEKRGDVLQKAGGLTPQEREAVEFAKNHKMDGKNRETDYQVFKAIYSAATGRPAGSGHILGSTLDLLTGR
jgi:hypothetical protein